MIIILSPLLLLLLLYLTSLRQPEAAKDGPGFTPWQAYYTRNIHGTLAPRAYAPQRTPRWSTVARAYYRHCEYIYILLIEATPHTTHPRRGMRDCAGGAWTRNGEYTIRDIREFYVTALALLLLLHCFTSLSGRRPHRTAKFMPWRA